jgi:hypothetical protein
VRLPHRTLGLSHRLNDALLVVLGAAMLGSMQAVRWTPAGAGAPG